MIKTMTQWKPLSAFGDTAIASTICFCLNYQQGMKRNENPRPKLISSKDITGTNPFDVLARASIFLNCKIQTMFVKTNVSVSFTPPEVMNEHCLKMLYYHHGDVQRWKLDNKKKLE